MKIKNQAKLYDELMRAANRYAQLRTIFAGIPAKAEFITRADCPLSGVCIDVHDDDGSIRARFIDREVRLRWRYDGSGSGQGIIIAEDWSFGVKEPVRLWTIGFVATGETDLEKRDGASSNLNTGTDCAEIILTALDDAMSRPLQQGCAPSVRAPALEKAAQAS
jgi:hypothetical protein